MKINHLATLVVFFKALAETLLRAAMYKKGSVKYHMYVHLYIKRLTLPLW
jgi:hypothetical protein